MPVVSGSVRPSGWWYGLAGAIAFVGIAGAVILIIVAAVSYTDKVDDFDRTSVPGTLQVEITDTGGYSIYHEHDTDDILAPEPDVQVTSPSGAPVELDRYETSVTYTVDDHEGEGLYTFDADEVGTYEVEAFETGSVFDEGSGIAVGPGLGGGLVAAILGGILLGLVGVVAGVIIAVVVAVRRGRSKRARMAAVAAAGAQSSPWWNAPPPPP